MGPARGNRLGGDGDDHRRFAAKSGSKEIEVLQMAQMGLRMWGGYLQKTCKFCLSDFLHKQHRIRYCSRECAHAANPLWVFADKRHRSLRRRSDLSFAANILAVQAELRERLARGFAMRGQVYPNRPAGAQKPMVPRGLAGVMGYA
jgi:hypothetical protein